LRSESRLAKALSPGEGAKTEVLSILSEINATFKEQFAYAGRAGREETAVGVGKSAADVFEASTAGSQGPKRFAAKSRRKSSYTHASVCQLT
jgi:hypothetical protein